MTSVNDLKQRKRFGRIPFYSSDGNWKRIFYLMTVCLPNWLTDILISQYLVEKLNKKFHKLKLEGLISWAGTQTFSSGMLWNF